MDYFFSHNKIEELNGADCQIVKSSLLSRFPELIQGTSTRTGGVSSGIHSTMNLGFYNGDLPGNVKKNYEIISSVLGTSPENIVLARQTHKSNIRIVTDEDRGKGVTRPADYEDIDALITLKQENRQTPVLGIITADCAPVSIYDPVHMAIGLAHSGWKGTVLRITGEVLLKMEQVFETDPRDVLISVGPTICRKCYRVGEDVAEAVRRTYEPEEYSGFLFENRAEGNYSFDISKAIKATAIRAGVKEENIEITGLCTCCNSGLLFSHRATMGKRGTLATFLGIK